MAMLLERASRRAEAPSAGRETTLPSLAMLAPRWPTGTREASSPGRHVRGGGLADVPLFHAKGSAQAERELDGDRGGLNDEDRRAIHEWLQEIPSPTAEAEEERARARCHPMPEQAGGGRRADPCSSGTHHGAQVDDREPATSRSGLLAERQILQLLDPTVAFPQPSADLASGKVTRNVAGKLIENLSRGEPPFKTELGKGGASWFVSEGNPYIGQSSAEPRDVAIPIELEPTKDALVFTEKELVELFEHEKSKISMAEVEGAYRKHHGIEESTPLLRKQRKSLARLVERLAESRMWDEVGRKVRQSAAKVGEVVLQNSRFSREANGKFLVVADDSKIKIKGGAETVVQAMEAAGHSAEPVLVEAAQELASRQKWAGRVRAVFRHGGRILIVVAAANDALYVYYAHDKKKAVITVAGGWAGATASASAFALWFAPADSVGPWAWAAHGVGTLVAGGVGYWIGSETTRTIYELVVEPEL